MNIDKKVDAGLVHTPLPMMQKRITEMPPVFEKDDSILHGIIPAEDFDVIIEDK